MRSSFHVNAHDLFARSEPKRSCSDLRANLPCHFFKAAPTVDSVARADTARLLADQGDPAAKLEDGHYLMEGESVEGDREEAARYFKLSADQGNSDGQKNYDRCFE
jgi:TPR repeat protein